MWGSNGNGHPQQPPPAPGYPYQQPHQPAFSQLSQAPQPAYSQSSPQSMAYPQQYQPLQYQQQYQPQQFPTQYQPAPMYAATHFDPSQFNHQQEQQQYQQQQQQQYQQQQQTPFTYTPPLPIPPAAPDANTAKLIAQARAAAAKVNQKLAKDAAGRATATSTVSLAANKREFEGEAYPDERPSMGLGLGASSGLGATPGPGGGAFVSASAKTAAPSFVGGDWMSAGDTFLAAIPAELGPDGKPAIVTSFGAFTSFQKGGILDPNKSAAEALHQKNKAETERKAKELLAQPKKVVRVEDFANQRVSKRAKHQDKAGAGTMGSMLANMRKKQQKEALESYKKLQKEDGGGGVTDPFKFAVRPDADTAQLVLDVRAHHELTNRGQLRIAAESGLVEVVEALLKESAHNTPEAINATSSGDGCGAVHMACSGGHGDVVFLLLKAGGDVRAQTNGGLSPLLLSCREGHVEVAELLMSRGALVSDEGNGESLLLAARGGHLAMVKCLVYRGVEASTILSDEEVTVEVAEYLQLLLSTKRILDEERQTGRPALHLAVAAGDLAVAEEVLGAQDSADQMHGGVTPLFVACDQAYPFIVEFLVLRGADVNFHRESDGWTPLMAAARADAFGAIKVLMENGADVAYRSPAGETALSVAERQAEDAILPAQPTPFAMLMLRLLEKREELQPAFFDDLADVLAQAYDEDSPPLLTAVERQDDDYVLCLLDNGCPIDTPDAEGNTALLVAACLGRQGTVEVLLERGADVKAANAVGATSLHQSCQRNFAALASFLIEKGADVNDVTFRGGISPLMLAACYGAKDCALVLHEQGANLEYTFEGKNALEYALEEGQEEVAETIRACMMEVACESGSVENVQWLVSKGADVSEVITPNGFTALHIAATFGQFAVVKILLDHKAAPNVVQQSGASPLHFACQKGHNDVVELLLQHQADASMASFKGGITPLMMAARFGNGQAAQMLLAAGADASAEFDGKKSSGWAADQGHAELARVLRDTEQRRKFG